jgi:hypothetical protein
MGIVGVLYAATITTAALTALFARDPTRRRGAQRVLKILLHRRPHSGTDACDR